MGRGQASTIGATFDYASFSGLCAGLRSQDAETITTNFLVSMFTPALTPEDKAWTLARNLTLPREHASAMLFHCGLQDWRDVLPRINIPTLVIGGEASLFPAAGIRWMASQIPGAGVRMFTKEEHGSHFMFWENAALFNKVVHEFLNKLK